MDGWLMFACMEAGLHKKWIFSPLLNTPGIEAKHLKFRVTDTADGRVLLEPPDIV
jgi:hypothetical protein